jgi:hypothetical protein
MNTNRPDEASDADRLDRLRDTTPYEDPDRQITDPALARLFTAWWTASDKNAALALAERLRELSTEEIAEVLMEFRNATARQEKFPP